VVGIGEVAQALGVAVQPLAERAGDVCCPLIEHGGAAPETGGVLIGPQVGDLLTALSTD
jgi:hypothetical protein